LAKIRVEPGERKHCDTYCKGDVFPGFASGFCYTTSALLLYLSTYPTHIFEARAALDLVRSEPPRGGVQSAYCRRQRGRSMSS